MTKKIRDEGFGVTRLFLGWIPQERHLRQNIPICFTAETNERYVEGTFTVRVVVVVVVIVVLICSSFQPVRDEMCGCGGGQSPRTYR